MTVTTSHGKCYIATVSHGEPRVLRGPHSDVSLHIPTGYPGVFLKAVHTNLSTFRGDIPDEECMITPMVEIHHLNAYHKSQTSHQNFIIKLPHCIQDKEKWNLIKVRKWSKNKVGSTICQELKENENFVVDNKFITVSTRHFCRLAGTICDNEGCRRSLRVIIMAKLECRWNRNLSLVKLKSFLCSRLLVLKDFRQVSSTNLYMAKAVKIIRMRAECI